MSSRKCVLRSRPAKTAWSTLPKAIDGAADPVHHLSKKLNVDLLPWSLIHGRLRQVRTHGTLVATDRHVFWDAAMCEPVTTHSNKPLLQALRQRRDHSSSSRGTRYKQRRRAATTMMVAQTNYRRRPQYTRIHDHLPFGTLEETMTAFVEHLDSV